MRVYDSYVRFTLVGEFSNLRVEGDFNGVMLWAVTRNCRDHEHSQIKGSVYKNTF